MNDLDWLARNVHEWPETPVMITPGGPMLKHGATFYPDRCLMRDHFGLEYCFAKSDWLARRAELQNKPRSDAAPTKHAITNSKYTKTINGVSVDVYDVLQAWNVINPALQHLIKKALQCGQRGHKDNAQDLQDIIDSAIRAKELES